MFLPVASYAQKEKTLAMQWKIAAKLPVERGQQKALGFAGMVAGVHANAMIIAGGANFPDSMPWQNGKKKYYKEVYVYEKKGAQIIKHPNKFELPSAIAYAASCSTSKGIIYAGGENENGISKQVFLLRWDKRKSVIAIEPLTDLPVALTNATLTTQDDIAYLAGGETSTASSDQFFCFDLNDPVKGWRELPRLPKPVSHMVLVSQAKNIYMVGGRKRNANGISDFYSSVFAFNIKENKWHKKQSMPYTLCAGTGIGEGENKMLMFGGDRSETFHQVEQLIAEINHEEDEVKKQELTLRKNTLQSMHPGFSKEILVYDTKKDEWDILGKLPYSAPVTTVVFRWDKDVIIPSGEIRAGVRSSDILVGKLFYFDK